MMLVPVPSGIVTILVATGFYVICSVMYRLYFSALSKFPGPKIAAALGWYRFYYDYWCRGQYVFIVKEMHKIYGPVVRISPDELSIQDPDFYDTIYVTGSKRQDTNFDQHFTGIDFHGSHFLTTDHYLHQRRRKPLEPFFSRLGISRLQPMLAECTFHLESRFRDLQGTQTITNLDHAFCAYSGDIIRRICLGDDDTEGRFLDDPRFAPYWYVRPATTFQTVYVLLANSGCDKLQFDSHDHHVNTFVSQFSVAWEKARSHIREALGSAEGLTGTDRYISLFRSIAYGDMSSSEKSVDRLAQEAQVLLGAGTANTFRILSFASYHILSQPELRERLEAELRVPMSEWPRLVPTWTDLEKLPLLQAIIKESLRLNYGASHRLLRVSPVVPIQYKDFIIPPGVRASISLTLKLLGY
ncbi:cytochrome P450 [Apiospora arundinis]